MTFTFTAVIYVFCLKPGWNRKHPLVISTSQAILWPARIDRTVGVMEELLYFVDQILKSKGSSQYVRLNNVNLRLCGCP